jgi:hypothetical protein
MPARWTAPNGTTTTGKITAMTGPADGNTVMMWTNASGRVTGPPLSRAAVVGWTVAAAGFTEGTFAPVESGLPTTGRR